MSVIRIGNRIATAQHFEDWNLDVARLRLLRVYYP